MHTHTGAHSPNSIPLSTNKGGQNVTFFFFFFFFSSGVEGEEQAWYRTLHSQHVPDSLQVVFSLIEGDCATRSHAPATYGNGNGGGLGWGRQEGARDKGQCVSTAN